jgi:thiol-disulfide isomerase/thioredoxin
MKYIILPLLVLPVMSLAQENTKSYELSITLKNFAESAKVSKFYLYYYVNGEKKTDSALLNKGRFVLKGRVHEPVLADLHAIPVDTTSSIGREYEYLRYSIYIEPGKQKLIAQSRLHTTNFTSKSSHTNLDYIKLTRQSAAYDDRIAELYKAYNGYKKAADKMNQLRLEESIDSLNAEIRQNVYGVYVRKNPSSPVAIHALLQFAGKNMNTEVVESLYNSLSSKIKNYELAKSLWEKIQTAKLTGIGNIALNFIQNDTLDQPVNLASFRGKYVLIDFWASWCIPCRAENPNLIQLFDRYKNRNFHILGVSLDRPGQKEKWMKAIHEDGLTWTQVSDLKFWDNAVVKLYRITSIPQNLLLGPDGTIIAKNLKGQRLEKKVREVIEGKSDF